MYTMCKKIIYQCLCAAGIALMVAGCKTPVLVEKSVSITVPERYQNSRDTTNMATIAWRDFFEDPVLQALVDTALSNNQELNITLQEIKIARNEVMARKGEYLPFVDIRTGAGVEKPGRYTVLGATEATTDIEPGREMPDPIQDYLVGAFASWEVDIWHKLRNARQAAAERYLATVDGRNFMVTNLVAEIAHAYYELLALDNQLAITRQNIEIQSNALEIVKLQKEATRVTELAVRRFEAQVFKTRSLLFDIQQQITETENRINFLVGRFPQPIERSSQSFSDLVPQAIQAGIPSQLLENRPDIQQAERELVAARLDVQVAKANFYPSLDITAGIGLQAFNPSFLLKTPESMLYSLAGDLTAPLINKKAIKATYASANARQIQAVYEYERTLLNAYIEVANQMANISNMTESYALRVEQVEALNESVVIANDLFRSARADYMEVLMTQRDALESEFELIETKMQQMNAVVNIYQALGGGWN